MITIKLGEKNYQIDFISGRALRELEPAAKMYARIVSISNAAIKGEAIPEADTLTISEAMDVMVKWFCLVFSNQFTPDDLLDNYPVDRLMHDIALTLMAVQTQTTSILSEFPTQLQRSFQPSSAGPADDECGDESGNDSEQRDGNLTLPDFIYTTYNSLLENGWKMNDIDGMDMLGYLKVRAWKAKRDQEKKAPVHRYIDEVWGNMKPDV